MDLKKILITAAGVIAIAAVIFGSIHIYSTAVARKLLNKPSIMSTLFLWRLCSGWKIQLDLPIYLP